MDKRVESMSFPHFEINYAEIRNIRKVDQGSSSAPS